MKDSGKLQEIKSEKSHISDSINCYQYDTTGVIVTWVGEEEAKCWSSNQKNALIF